MLERVVFTPTPEPLMQLCLECRRANCNGEKCDDYRNLERKIKMNASGKRPRNVSTQASDSYLDVVIPTSEPARTGRTAACPQRPAAPPWNPKDSGGLVAAPSETRLLSEKPKMDIVPLCTPPHDAVAQAHGLKLWNLTIEALDKLLDEEDMEEVGSFAGMLKALKRQRFELFGDRIDWHALGEE